MKGSEPLSVYDFCTCTVHIRQLQQMKATEETFVCVTQNDAEILAIYSGVIVDLLRIDMCLLIQESDMLFQPEDIGVSGD